MPAQARRISGWLSLAVFGYFIVTAPAQAAQFTRDLLCRLEDLAQNGIVFLTNLTT
ncbi:hypothetical protein QFW96_27645 [Saccharopolyspora sp. TS4A08]|uniref:Uncharacterized protein n=1 Tax=Saccharopolyspora ipomoeae TaxID=3042027 RepID=A0ABT6PWP2_9PSEU|nr:hypothetical protein [Saccharopolyspora sp. TS4A08]MDI2032425.1 hypothetical protein [Saccharopolyspora sp. TS4A08]